jgi:predicted nucleotidyltransferase component of viral defense system
MRPDGLRDLSASVRQRLLNLAKERNEDFQRVLNRYAAERLLYRLSCSEHRDRFVLKGALLWLLWSPERSRPTRDVDLLAFGDPSPEALLTVFRSLCSAETSEPDGLTLVSDSLAAASIREDMEYGGVRVTLQARLGVARIPMQVDVGFGDVIIPAPSTELLPSLLDQPPPRLRVYPRETVIAEKTEAMIRLGLDNSRMKDFYDLWMLGQCFAFEGALVKAALSATLERRGTLLPEWVPVALTDTFADNPSKRAQWRAFLRRTASMEEELDLAEVAESLRAFLMPPLESLREDTVFASHWPPGGPWT